MDEVGLNDGEFAAIDETEHDDTEIDGLIESKAEEALRYVYNVADESLVPWSQLEFPEAKYEYKFDGLAPEEITIQDTGYSGDIAAILFSQENHCFVAVPRGLGEPTYYRIWNTAGVDYSMYLEPRTDCLYAYTEEGVTHKYYYNANAMTLDGPIFTSVISSQDFRYNVFETRFTFEDVWRWNYIRLSSWRRSISSSEAIDVNSPAGAMLYDEFCTGTWERPKVGIDYQDDGTVFYLFSMKGDLEYAILSYIPKPSWYTEEQEEKLAVGDKLVDAFYYYLAGLVCMTLGDERQQGFFQQAAELMGKKNEATAMP